MKRKKRSPLRAPFSLANPPTGYTMSVLDLAELVNMSRNHAYDAVKRGVYPSIRSSKKGGTFRILTVPTLAILRGELPPGPRARSNAR
jgi:hypothetical protein